MPGLELGDDDELEQPAARPVVATASDGFCAGCGCEVEPDAYECPHCGEVQDAPTVLSGPLEVTVKAASAGGTPAHDVLSAPRRGVGRFGREKRPLTPEEQAVADERRKRKAEVARFLELLSPAGAVEGDLPVRDNPLADVSKVRAKPLLRLPRLSGTGGAGTALVVRAQHYSGLTGGEPRDYALLYVEFHDAGSHRVRSRGVTINASDVDDVIMALAAWKAGLSRE